MGIAHEISHNRAEFESICIRHGIEKLFAFGSSVSTEFNTEKSDLDFVVELNITDPLDRGETIISLWNNLEELFKRQVDLLTNNSIQNPFLRDSINATKVLIYDGQKQKVLI